MSLCMHRLSHEILVLISSASDQGSEEIVPTRQSLSFLHTQSIDIEEGSAQILDL